jgi:hypothetical protein
MILNMLCSFEKDPLNDLYMITSSYRHIAAIENASMAQLFIVIFSDRRQHGFQAMDFAFAVPFCLHTRPGNQCLQVAISQVEEGNPGTTTRSLENGAFHLRKVSILPSTIFG